MTKEELLLEKWKMASELHRHEDDLTWQRLSYFVTFTGILASALAVIWGTKDISVNRQLATILISTSGIFISVIFTFLFKGAQMFHLYRAAQAKEAEHALLIGNEQLQILDIYTKGLKEQNLIRVEWLGKYSAYNLITILCIVLVLLWTVLLILGIFVFGP